MWRVHGNIGKVLKYTENESKTKLEGEDLAQVLRYATQESKTKTQIDDEHLGVKTQLVSGINCSAATAFTEMLEQQRYYGKTDGVTAYHGYQSFGPGECTPQQAHEIGVRLARELWGNRYQVVVATHLDKANHLHNHFVINTVSFVDGKKYFRSSEDYRNMQEASDRLCRENHLSIIRNPSGRGMSYSEWLAEKNGVPTVRGCIRKDIDEAIKESLSTYEFVRSMEQRGYVLKIYGEHGQMLKYPSLKPPGAKGFFRFHKLGEGYSLAAISDRILDNFRRQLPFTEEEIKEAARYRREQKPRSKLHGIYALYIRYCFELHTIKEKPAAAYRMPALLKADIAKLDRFDRQVRFMAENRIETLDELRERQTTAEEHLRELSVSRRLLRNDVKRKERAGDEEGITAQKEKISAISDEMKLLREKVGICKEIEAASYRMAQMIEEIDRDKIPEKEEHELLK